MRVRGCVAPHRWSLSGWMVNVDTDVVTATRPLRCCGPADVSRSIGHRHTSMATPPIHALHAGMGIFDELHGKLVAATTQSLKDKYEAELKRELKKLQRFRD